MLVTTLLLLGVLIVFLALYIKWKQQYWKKRGVFQLDPHLLFGTSKPLVTGEKSMQDHFLELYKIGKAKGVKHMGTYNLWMPDYMPIDLEIVKRILSKDFYHFDGHGIYSHKSDPFSENLFTLEGNKWKELRTKMTPTFSSAKTKMMFETVLEKTAGVNKILSQAAQNHDGVNIRDVMARFATDIIGTVVFGLECNTLENPDHKFREIGRKAFEPRLSKFVLEQLFHPNILALFKYRNVPKDVKDYFTDVVKDTVKYREENNVQRKDFMQLLIQLKNRGTVSDDSTSKGKSFLTEQEVINEAFLFYIAGFETSSSTMTFALLELAQHPDMQDKLRQEILETLKKYDGKLTYEAVVEMEFLDKVVRETLRLYPVLSVLPRRCNKKYLVPGTDLVIEKGTMINIPVLGIQRDPEYYPNPDEFNPENFSAENKANRPDFTWMPFGEGPRQCIGMRIGLVQTKVGIITAVKDFKLTLDPRTELPLELDKFSIVFMTKNVVFLKVEKI